MASRHRTVVCESCHGPLAAHAAEGPDVAPVAAIAKPAAGLCAACHERAVARPAGFPQVALAEHFAQAPCIGCHDPHDAEALVPPDISHPLDRLPACTTCHEPEGLKPLPAGHVVQLTHRIPSHATVLPFGPPDPEARHTLARRAPCRPSIPSAPTAAWRP